MTEIRYFIPGGHGHHKCGCSDAEHRCSDCGAREGELHQYGCDAERCPFCGGQLISCPCRYEHLGFHWEPYEPYCGLPRQIYQHGLSEEQRETWRDILDEVGRVPHLVFHHSCGRCGEREPEMYMVPTWMWWMYIPVAHQGNTAVCLRCFQKIKKLVDERSGLHPGELVGCPACQGRDEHCEYCLGGPVDSRMVPRILEEVAYIEEDRRKFEAMRAKTKAAEKKGRRRGR